MNPFRNIKLRLSTNLNNPRISPRFNKSIIYRFDTTSNQHRDTGGRMIIIGNRRISIGLTNRKWERPNKTVYEIKYFLQLY